MIGIYKITSPTGRIYIGQSIDIEKRRKMYVNNHCHKQQKLHASLVKYGFSAHVFEVIEECDWEGLNSREEYWIEFYGTFNNERGLNLSSGGLNKRVSEETKRKISKSNSGRSRPDLTLFNLSRTGVSLSGSHKAKVSETLLGRNHKTESIELMRQKAFARPPRSAETKAKMSKAKLGVKPTEDAKAIRLKARLESAKTGKTVIDMVTGEEFKNLKYLCDLKGFCYGTMKRKMRGASKNNTAYEYKKPELI